ncbi:hypothetical protein PNF31_20695 [Priestia megaterium]|uniref:hypothetical protein n=1 Tax=Priestia megaterium TaxID=1404 RepID=UPI00234E8ACC|nr:hypothetical protein [Priestia megaterium]MDC7723230.1 hypothetical protein [Priestia megaterium]
MSLMENCSEERIVDAACFGVKRDGVTDDAPAIQQAIDYAEANKLSRVLLTGDYTYAIASPLVIKPSISFEMDSGTKLKVTGNYHVFTLQKDASISGGTVEVTDPSFISSVIYLHGSQQLETGNKTTISNISMINTSGAYNGKGIYFYCQKAWDFISFVNVSFVHLRNFERGVLLQTEKITNINTPAWINANNFSYLSIDGCQYGIDVAGISDVPYETSGNSFVHFQMQCRSQTKRAIKCSGAYNTFEGHIWDTYLMNGGEPPVEFTSISHRNQLASNLLSTSILNNGQYNDITSPFEQTRNIFAPGLPGKPDIIGNQDDIFVQADKKYTVKQTAGKVPYGGSISNCFSLIDEQSMNYLDVPSSAPVVIEMDFTANPIKMLNMAGVSFGWGESPKNIKFEYLTALDGAWTTAKDVKNNLGNTVTAEVRANTLYKMRLTLSEYTKDHKRFRINRIFGTSSMMPGSSWVATSGSKMYGNLEFQQGNSLILKSPDGQSWKLSVDNTGKVSGTKI